MNPKNPYTVLGVPTQATSGEIKTAYRQAARKAHPDTGGSAADFRIIQEAWAILGNPQKRQKYDRFITSRVPAVNITQQRYTQKMTQERAAAKRKAEAAKLAVSKRLQQEHFAQAYGEDFRYAPNELIAKQAVSSDRNARLAFVGIGFVLFSILAVFVYVAFLMEGNVSVLTTALVLAFAAIAIIGITVVVGNLILQVAVINKRMRDWLK
jgi:DnaJ domain